MKVELADERIAQWVYKNAPIEDKAHALAEQFVQERYRHYCSSKNLLLSYHELAFIAPHLQSLNLTPEQAVFIATSQKKVKHKRRSQQIQKMSIVALVVGLIVSTWGFWERQRYTNASDNLAQAQDSIGKIWETLYQERSVMKADPPPMAAALPAFRAVVLQGVVTNPQGQPLAGATVHLLGAQVSTNPQGFYQIHLVFSPQQVEPRPALTIYKAPFQPLTQSVALDQDTIEADATLLPQ